MKKQFLLPALVLFGFTALTSCKKDNDDAVNPSVTACKVDYAITTVGTVTDSTKLTFDSQNRVIKEHTYNNNTSTGYTLYEYSSNKIVQKDYDATSTLVSQTEYRLNSNNNVSYSVLIEGGDTDNADTTWYNYNAEKNNTRRVTKNTTSFLGVSTSTYDTTWYTYTAGNLTKLEEKEGNGPKQTTVFDYGSNDAKSEFLAPEQDYSFLENIYGDNSKKLPTSVTTGSDTYTFVYQFNSDGYATQYKVMDGATTLSNNRFVYNCK